MIAASRLDHWCYCASYLAYLVDGKGHFLPNLYPQHYKDNPFIKYMSGYTKVTAFSNEEGWLVDKINAAILMEYPTYNILAFRGTLSSMNCPSLQDWIQDLNVAPVYVDRYNGAVHEGIYHAYETLREDIFQALSHQQDKPLIITGHSKGGPMTSYAAFDAIAQSFKVVHLATIASPRPGDVDFYQSYSSLLGSAQLTQIRFENDLDIIPLLPPEQESIDDFWRLLEWIGYIIDVAGDPRLGIALEVMAEVLKNATDWNYYPVGKLQYINKNHNIVGAHAGLWETRKTQFENQFRTHWYDPWKAVENIFSAHSISLHHGYQEGIFPGFH